jgi:hypothetical protein
MSSDATGAVRIQTHTSLAELRRKLSELVAEDTYEMKVSVATGLFQWPDADDINGMESVVNLNDRNSQRLIRHMDDSVPMSRALHTVPNLISEETTTSCVVLRLGGEWHPQRLASPHLCHGMSEGRKMRRYQRKEGLLVRLQLSPPTETAPAEAPAYPTWGKSDH